MENNETNIQAYSEVVMNKAFLDWEMQCLQTKIRSKNEENSRLENQIYERRNIFEKLKKSANSSCEREEKVKNNINVLRNSRAITEGLLISMKHQLLVHEEKRMEIENVRKSILKKYTMLFESHSKMYSNLPWVQKTNGLKISIERRKIQLNICKLEYSSLKKKTALYYRIANQRIVVAITKLAKDIVARNNLQKEVNALLNDQKAFVSKIKALTEEKIMLQERIEMKVKEAMKEARDRVVKSHVGANIGEKLNSISRDPNLVIPSISNQLKPTNESIFFRLGLSVPHTLKRASTIRPRVPDKVPYLNEKPKQMENPVAEMVHAFKEKTTETNDGNLEVPQVTTVLESVQVNEPVKEANKNETDDPKKMIHKEIDKSKKKLKKKVKKNNSESALMVKKENQNIVVPKNSEVTGEEVPLKEKSNQPNDKSVVIGEIDSEPPAEISEEITNKRTKSHEKEISRSIEPVEEISHNKMVLIDPEMDNSNLSVLDNISVVSSTFTNEIRNQMDQSPDFLTQTPQGYCFSPLFSPSKTDNATEVSTEKGAKSPSYDFPNTSIVTPIFPMETQKAPGGTPSDFASFFGTSSPKKSEKSTKNFFQLFG